MGLRQKTVQQTRNSSSGPPPVYEGFEAKLRVYLPEDKHVVMGVLGTYFGIYMLIKMVSGGGSEEEEKEVPVVAVSSDTEETNVPSMLAPAFEAWSKIPGNMKKWEDSFSTFDDEMKDPSKVKQYEAQFQ